MCSFLGTSGGESLPGSSTLYRCVSGRNPEAIDDAEGVSGAFICCSAAKVRITGYPLNSRDLNFYSCRVSRLIGGDPSTPTGLPDASSFMGTN